MNENRRPKQENYGAIGALALFPTYRCTAECSHCFAASSTRKEGLMEIAEMREYLDEARKAGAKSVTLFGGEPFIYFDLLAEGIQHAGRIGLESAVISNAFWATSGELALRRLRLLKERGLGSIGFSPDPFHCEYVPFEHVRNAIVAAKSLDMYAFAYDCLFDERNDDGVIGCAREIAARLLPHEIWERKLDGIMFRGTAAEVLAGRAAQKQSWQSYRTCQLDVLWQVTVDPYGHVQPGLCLGISMGNARQTKLSEIIAKYDPQAHPILGPLYEGGPAALARLAMQYGFEPTEYADECHLCYKARKVLLDHYPEHLAPAIYYERAK